MVRRLLLALLAGWAGAGFLAEVDRAVTGYDGRTTASASPLLWRPGMPEIVRLERCLAPARRSIPAGTAVAFASPDEPPGAAAARWLWAGYLMPAHDLIPASDPAAARLAAVAIACGTGIDDPRLAPVRGLPGGRLYRVRR